MSVLCKFTLYFFTSIAVIPAIITAFTAFHLVPHLPNFHGPVGAAGHENLGVESVPAHLVYSHVMGIDGVDKVACVGFGANVDLTFLCTYQEQVVFLLVEVKGGATSWCKKKIV